MASVRGGHASAHVNCDVSLHEKSVCLQRALACCHTACERKQCSDELVARPELLFGMSRSSNRSRTVPPASLPRFRPCFIVPPGQSVRQLHSASCLPVAHLCSGNSRPAPPPCSIWRTCFLQTGTGPPRPQPQRRPPQQQERALPVRSAAALRAAGLGADRTAPLRTRPPAAGGLPRRPTTPGARAALRRAGAHTMAAGAAAAQCAAQGGSAASQRAPPSGSDESHRKSDRSDRHGKTGGRRTSPAGQAPRLLFPLQAAEGAAAAAAAAGTRPAAPRAARKRRAALEARRPSTGRVPPAGLTAGRRAGSWRTSTL